jgi:hypothetical protein
MYIKYTMQERNCKGPEKKRLKQKAANFCWMRSSLLASEDVTIPNHRGVFKLRKK